MSAPKLTDRVMSWRYILKVHPACELFPPLSPDELRARGEDIKKNRLQERAKVMRQGDKFVLLDGRSRLDAIEAVGLPIKVFEGNTPNNNFFEVIEKVDDPVAYVISANIHRRHLTGEQRREVIATLLKACPERSDRQIAKQIGASPSTVGTVRREAENKGDVSKLDTRADSKGRQQPAHKSKPGIPPPDAERSAVERKQRYAADNLMAVISAKEAIKALCDAISHATPEEVVAESDSAELIKLATDVELGSAWLGALAKSAAERAGDCQDGEVS